MKGDCYLSTCFVFKIQRENHNIKNVSPCVHFEAFIGFYLTLYLTFDSDLFKSLSSSSINFCSIMETKSGYNTQH